MIKFFSFLLIYLFSLKLFFNIKKKVNLKKSFSEYLYSLNYIYKNKSDSIDKIKLNFDKVSSNGINLIRDFIIYFLPYTILFFSLIIFRFSFLSALLLSLIIFIPIKFRK